jgi:hypothetical protein
VLTLTPNAKGGSRVPFSLAWTGDLTGAFALDGEISPRLRIGGLDTKGTIVLAGGKFNRAKAAGRLIIPCIFPEKVLAGLKGGGKDTLNATIGFATPGTGPASLDPGFTFAFGPSFTADVAASSFGPKKKEKFTYKNKAGGLTDVVVDYAKGVVTVKGKGLDLGTFTDGANEVTIRIVVAGVERIVVVRLTKSGPKLVY